jgi:hypothetical protein
MYLLVETGLQARLDGAAHPASGAMTTTTCLPMAFSPKKSAPPKRGRMDCPRFLARRDLPVPPQSSKSASSPLVPFGLAKMPSATVVVTAGSRPSGVYWARKWIERPTCSTVRGRVRPAVRGATRRPPAPGSLSRPLNRASQGQAGHNKRPLGSLAEWPLRRTAGALRFHSSSIKTNTDVSGSRLKLHCE